LKRKLFGSLSILSSRKICGSDTGKATQRLRTGTTRYGAGDVLAVPAVRKDGTRISVEFTILPFSDEAGQMIGIAAMLRDVTRRFEEMKALRKRSRAVRKKPTRGKRIFDRIPLMTHKIIRQRAPLRYCHQYVIRALRLKVWRTQRVNRIVRFSGRDLR
jgi:hypothetical protein